MKEWSFQRKKNIGKKFEKYCVVFALNVLHAKKEKIYPPYVSKHNSTREKQVILLMISNGEGWHYVAVKKLSQLFRRIKSKHHGDFYCLNCLHSFATEKNLSLVKNYVKIKIFLIQLYLLKTLKHKNLINIKNLIKQHFLFMQIFNV